MFLIIGGIVVAAVAWYVLKGGKSEFPRAKDAKGGFAAGSVAGSGDGVTNVEAQ